MTYESFPDSFDASLNVKKKEKQVVFFQGLRNQYAWMLEEAYLSAGYHTHFVDKHSDLVILCQLPDTKQVFAELAEDPKEAIMTLETLAQIALKREKGETDHDLIMVVYGSKAVISEYSNTLRDMQMDRVIDAFGSERALEHWADLLKQ